MSEEIVIQNQETKRLRVSIKTMGCQMNEYDTEVAEGLLQSSGFEVLSDPKISNAQGRIVSEADVFLMNTCSIREHAEERVYGRLGMLSKAKKDNPELILGLLGCMVEEHRENLFKRFPDLDLMVGTRNIKDLPSLIEEVRQTRRQVSRIKHEGISIEYTDQIKRAGTYHAWLPIMTGCNKVCTFCIVPITRGSEVSMPAREVYREASRLVNEGVKWITLLGQNVNSYRGRPPMGPSPSAFPDCSFPQLLEMLCQINGLDRISFTTSHPSDATEELYQVIARNPKISRRFHLPLQSGSDAMLKRMKRLHTYPEFKEKIRRMREMIPDISVTTDVIAGFSGETEEDHRATMESLAELRFDSAYIYKYSLRPGTPASKLPDDVPMEIKTRRNAELLGLQKAIENENNRTYLGKTAEVFVEDISSKNPACVLGRTHHERTVVFKGDKKLIGTFQKVRLNNLYHQTYLASLVGADPCVCP